MIYLILSNLYLLACLVLFSFRKTLRPGVKWWERLLAALCAPILFLIAVLVEPIADSLMDPDG